MSQGQVSAITLINARTTDFVQYIPAYIRQDGKAVPPKASVTVYVNLKPYNGQEQKISMKIVGWGGMADLMARSLSKGKEVHPTGELEQYMGRLFDSNGQVRSDAQGQVIMVPKTALRLTSILFGADSKKTINDEIARGVRPAGWDQEGTPAHQQWLQVVNARKNAVYQGGATFGHAKVFAVPAGASVNQGYYQKQLASKQGQQAAPQQQAATAQGEYMAAANMGGNVAVHAQNNGNVVPF